MAKPTGEKCKSAARLQAVHTGRFDQINGEAQAKKRDYPHWITGKATADNATLSATPTYIDDPTTGHCNPALSYTFTIEEVDALNENIADNKTVTVADGTVTVNGVPAGEQVDVIDLSGRIIASQKAADDKATYSLQRGFYLLKTTTRTFKLRL